jgi:hypothetical protein
MGTSHRERRSMNISTLVKALNSIKAQEGDLPVYLSSDSEGNSYSDLGDKPSDSIYWDDEQVILYPFREGIELELSVPKVREE